MILFLDIDRERPKYQIPKDEDEETPTNGTRAIGETSDTVKVSRNTREETIHARLVKPNIYLSFLQNKIKKILKIINDILIELLLTVAATRVKLLRMLDGTLVLGDQTVRVLFEVW